MHATRFASAALTYDLDSRVQRLAGQCLSEQIQTDSPSSIIDFGCGTGWLTQRLAHRFSKAQIIGIDHAVEMVQYAEHTHHHPQIEYKCFKRFETVDCRAEVVFSNACLQWVLNAAVHDISGLDYLVASAQSECVFSVLTCRTAFELSDVLVHVRSDLPSIPAVHFFDRVQLADRIMNRYPNATLWGQDYVQRFDSCKSLLRQFKRTGATVPSTSRIVWTASLLNQLEQQFYDRFGGVQMTFSFLMGRISR